MSYATRLSLSGIDFTSSVTSMGGSAAQASTLNKWAAADTANPPSSDYGNVPPQYAGTVLHWDGTVGPASDLASFIAKYSGPNQSGPYWQGILNSNRYVVILNAAGEPVGTIGAISAPAAAVVLSTYVPVAGDTSGRAVSTDKTAAADALAQGDTVKAQLQNPVQTTSQTSTGSKDGTPIVTPTPVHLPYGTPVTMANGQQGYADGNGGVIAGPPPGGDATPMQMLINPFPSNPVFDTADATPVLDTSGSVIGTTAPSFSLSSGALWALGGLGVLLLLSGRRSRA